MYRIVACVICICILVFGPLVEHGSAEIGSDLKKRKAAVSAALPAADLFFSEYIEGSSNNKAIEIYNGTGAAVNLGTGAYTLEMYANGATTATATKILNGIVAYEDVYVVAHSLANMAIINQADDAGNNVLSIDGNDALVLKKAGVIIDVIGQIGNNPITEWGTGLTSTADNTLVRKPNICSGDAVGSNAFDPATEWNGFAVDTFSNLGSHTSTCNAPPPPNISINDVSQAEGQSGTTTFTFTVSLSSAAPAGGVTFDISTADNTAVSSSDYTSNSLTGQTIAAGNSTYQFSVSVIGDSVYEANQTFFVNITNITGATALDIQGQGTIVNDDIAPSAGPVTIAGRVLTAEGRSVGGALVTLTGSSGETLSARTSTFGYYKFENVPGGDGYVVSVSAKRYKFSPRFVNAEADVAGFDFYAEQ